MNDSNCKIKDKLNFNKIPLKQEYKNTRIHNDTKIHKDTRIHGDTQKYYDTRIQECKKNKISCLNLSKSAGQVFLQLIP